MANTTTAEMQIRLTFAEKADPTADPGTTGEQTGVLENETGGRRWKAGQASGQVDAAYRRIRTVGSGATDTYNVLAAGSLTTPLGETIDLDELKALMVKCTAGSVKVVGGTSNPCSCFTGSGEGVVLTAGQAFALDLGAAGIDVTTNSQFEVIEATSGATADYLLEFVGAE